MESHLKGILSVAGFGIESLKVPSERPNRRTLMRARWTFFFFFFWPKYVYSDEWQKTKTTFFSYYDSLQPENFMTWIIETFSQEKDPT